MNNQVDLSDDEDDPDHRPEVNAGPPAEICGFNTEDPEIPGLSDGEEASRSLIDQVLVLVPFDSPPLLHWSGVKLPILRPYAVPMAVPDEVQEAVPDEVQEAVPDEVQEAVPDDIPVAVPEEVQDDVAVAVKDDAAVVGPLPNAASVSSFIQKLYQVLMDSLDDSNVSNLINWVDEYHFEVKDKVQLAEAYFPLTYLMTFDDIIPELLSNKQQLSEQCSGFTKAVVSIIFPEQHFEEAAQPNVWRHQTEFFRMGKPELLEQIESGILAAQTPKDEGTSGQANFAQDLKGVLE